MRSRDRSGGREKRKNGCENKGLVQGHNGVRKRVLEGVFCAKQWEFNVAGGADTKPPFKDKGLLGLS